jgi:hypothetical protein
MTGTRKDSGYERVEGDWYVEDNHSVDLLFHHVEFPKGIHDPCCGMRTILHRARVHGVKATGCDIVDRRQGREEIRDRFSMQDFLSDPRMHPSIVTNPPFSLTQQIVEHALKHVRHGGRVAVIAQAKFLFSQVRHPLFTRPDCERVLILSKRPSMPPGQMLLEQGEACRKGGFADYMWIIWRVGHCRFPPGATIQWVM